jgi:hypothetical protein
MSKEIYPFWSFGKQGETPPKLRFQKVKEPFNVRVLRTIIRDKKTGKYSRV